MRTIHDLSIEELLEDIIHLAQTNQRPPSEQYQTIREWAEIALEKVRFEHANRQVDEFDQQAEDELNYTRSIDQGLRR